MKLKSLLSRKIMICIALVAGIAIGWFGVGQAIADNLNSQGKEIVSSFLINENGQTFGSSLYCTSPEAEPDLVQAMGIDGTEGYVLKKDLDGEEPKTPEEALIMEKAEKALGGRTIPLYAVDGKTVIGEFKIGIGVTEEIKK